MGAKIMKKVTVYKRDGSEAGTIGLPDDIFGMVDSGLKLIQDSVISGFNSRTKKI